MKSNNLCVFGLVMAVILLSGCAKVKEAAKGFAGISTEQLEQSRGNAIKNTVAYDYDTTLKEVQSALNKAKAYIYAQDPKKQMIAIYLSETDTTPVGIFLTKNGQSTVIEVVSPSTFAKESIASALSKSFEEKARSERAIEVSLSDIQAKANDKGITIALSTSDISGLGFIACEATIKFDPAAIKITSVNNSGSIVSAWGNPVYNITDGQVKVASYGVNSASGQGVLFNLAAEIAPDAKPGTSTLEIVSFKFNDGKTKTTLKNGTVTIIQLNSSQP
ncbi:MAG: cohesin domain-containing protein [Candidatus Omnitrophica bacterium]|jgi:hypothetical protein|nr:cohesin domain-containing protein [Candidatus Omnitrophota bacterium]